MLHYLDDLDSKMEAMRAHFEREAELEGPWTSYNASLGRPLLDAGKFLQGEKKPAATTDADRPSPVPPTMAENQDSTPPLLDLFSGQKT